MKKVKMDKDFQIYDNETNEWCDTVFSENNIEHSNVMSTLTLYSEDSNWRYYKTENSISYSTLFRKRKKMCPNCGVKL